MKRLITICATFMAFLSASAYDFCVDGIYYNILSETDKTCEVTYNKGDGTDYSGSIIIPTIANGYSVSNIGDGAFVIAELTSITIANSVTRIGNGAFTYCSLTSIIIPNSVTNIGDYAFSDCISLKSVTLSNSLTSIGDYAFSYCDSLTNITIPNSVTSIGNCAFNNCCSLTSITLQDGVTNIGNNAFSGCRLTSVTLPNGLTSIGDYAFSYCTGLTTITIPNSVTTIAANAFYECFNLNEVNISLKDSADFAAYISRSDISSVFHKSVLSGKSHNILIEGVNQTTITIPDGVTSIGKCAFFYCDNISTVIIPNSVTSIGNVAFSSCTGLSSISIPNSVTSIGDRAFEICSALDSISIPTSVTSIGYRTFYYCKSLTYISIPNSVTNIGNNAFSGCSSLTSVSIPNSVTTIGNYTFSHCSSLESVSIPNSVTTIGDHVFYDCTGLTSVSIPYSVVSIGTGAFSYCSSLNSITNLATTPQTITSTTFPADGITLHVLPGCADAYRLKEYWRDFVIKEDAVLPVAEEEATTYTIADGTEYTGTSITHAAKLKYTRDFVNTNWQALYIPFALSYDDFKDHLDIAWLNNVHMYDDDQDGDPDRTMLEFYVMSDGKTKPNTPYLARSKTGGVFTLNMDSVDISPAECNPFECSTFYQTFTVKGTYSGVSGSDMVSNHYYAPAGGGLKYTTNVNASLKPQRWYLKVTNKDGSSVTNLSPSIRVMIDGEEIEDEQTGIRSILSSGNDLRYTTLDGRTLSTDPVNPGIYVKGNKKIIIR